MDYRSVITNQCSRLEVVECLSGTGEILEIKYTNIENVLI